VIGPEDLVPINAVLDESDKILVNPVLTAHSVVSVERHSDDDLAGADVDVLRSQASDRPL